MFLRRTLDLISTMRSTKSSLLYSLLRKIRREAQHRGGTDTKYNKIERSKQQLYNKQNAMSRTRALTHTGT